ncbi:hypothetical protein [Neptunicoccus cionae]|nr:hypothetical protein [Amylibacter cionae]
MDLSDYDFFKYSTGRFLTCSDKLPISVLYAPEAQRMFAINEE